MPERKTYIYHVVVAELYVIGVVAYALVPVVLLAGLPLRVVAYSLRRRRR